jgi:hypothetical protein
MGRSKALLLLLCVLAACAATHTAGQADAGNAIEEPFICVVIRTFWGHGKYGDMALKKLIQSLTAQKHQR